MEDVIGNNVLHCGKISNGPVRMYVKRRKIAENFFASGGEIEVDWKRVKGERHDKKVIIFNIPPHVPHDVIIKQIAAHGVTPSSNMKFQRMAQAEGLNILAERRFIYILLDLAEKFPASKALNITKMNIMSFTMMLK